MVKNKWYERTHLTYKANRGWLIERGIVAFHWSNSKVFTGRYFRGENGMSYGKLPKFSE